MSGIFDSVIQGAGGGSGGSGDFVGPASALDGSIVLFDGTTGKLGKDAAVVLSTFAKTLLDDASAGAALTTLGVSAFVQTILDDADAAAVRTTIGAGTSSANPAGSGSEVQVRSSGTAFAAVTGSSSANGCIALVNQSAAAVPLSLTGAASQSGNYLELTANGAAAGSVFKVDSAGDHYLSRAAASPTRTVYIGDSSADSAPTYEINIGGTNNGGTLSYWGGNGRVNIRAGAVAYDVWEQLRGTNANTWRLYRTASSQTGPNWTNYERLALQSAAGYFEMAAESAGTGTADIDIKFTPKGSGLVRFGSHSAVAAELVTGYITIKDAGGTSRKIAVIS